MNPAISLDEIFGCLADPTRRDILQRVSESELTVSDIALPYDVSLPAISKHLRILEKAKLIVKRKEGKNQIVTLAPYALKSADEYLKQYRAMWQGRFDKLESLLSEEE